MNDLLSGRIDFNEQLIGLVLTILAIVFLVSALRSVFRLVMPVLVIGLVMVVFLGFTPTEVVHRGKQIVLNGSQFILDGIAPFLQPGNDGHKNNEGIGVPPEHNPFKDGEDVPSSGEKDIHIFRGQDDEGFVNKL